MHMRVVARVYALCALGLRLGECSAIAITNWHVAEILVSAANAPCDLRELPAQNPKAVPARGGYVTAGPLMRD